MAEWIATGWPVTLAAVYLPMLYLVLRSPQSSRSGPGIAKDRRRPNRLPDSELRVDVSADDEGRIKVTVTHLPTQLFATEAGQTRQLAERKAQDKLAALVREAQSARGLKQKQV